MRIRVCQIWDEQAQACMQEAWITVLPFGLPPLSAGEGAALGASAFVLFAVAWLLKRLRNSI